MVNIQIVRGRCLKLLKMLKSNIMFVLFSHYYVNVSISFPDWFTYITPIESGLRKVFRKISSMTHPLYSSPFHSRSIHFCRSSLALRLLRRIRPFRGTCSLHKPPGSRCSDISSSSLHSPSVLLSKFITNWQKYRQVYFISWSLCCSHDHIIVFNW